MGLYFTKPQPIVEEASPIMPFSSPSSTYEEIDIVVEQPPVSPRRRIPMSDIMRKRRARRRKAWRDRRKNRQH